MYNFLNTIWTWFVAVYQALTGFLRDLFKSLKNFFIDRFNDLLDLVTAIFGALFDMLNDMLINAFEFVCNVVLFFLQLSDPVIQACCSQLPATFQTAVNSMGQGQAGNMIMYFLDRSMFQYSISILAMGFTLYIINRVIQILRG